MSETVSLNFIGRRLDSLQTDVADVRRRMVALAERFSLQEQRMASMERRQAIHEERLDAVVERISKLEAVTSRVLLLVERLAKAQGIEDEP